MIDFETAWADQEDLDRLLQPRKSPNQELYWPNNNYGLSRAVKEYAGYPIDKPLFAIVPHGVYLNVDGAAPALEVQNPLPAVLSFPEYVDDAYARTTNKMVIPSAAPFLYALANMGGCSPRQDRTGTVFFPQHSTAKVHVHAPLEEIAERLTQLPDEYQPVTVCAHWYDYSIGLHEPFARRGMRIVSAGHLTDDEFVYRLIHIMAAHRYAGSNALGSNAFYAIAVGMPYWIMDAPTTVEADAGFPLSVPTERRAAENRRITSLFAELPTRVTPEQKQLAEYYLGQERFKSPAGLLADLKLAERRARYGR